MPSSTLTYNLGGMGCSAGVIALDLAKDLLQVGGVGIMLNLLLFIELHRYSSCQATELIWALLFHKFANFTPPPR